MTEAACRHSHVVDRLPEPRGDVAVEEQLDGLPEDRLELELRRGDLGETEGRELLAQARGVGLVDEAGLEVPLDEVARVGVAVELPAEDHPVRAHEVHVGLLRPATRHELRGMRDGGDAAHDVEHRAQPIPHAVRERVVAPGLDRDAGTPGLVEDLVGLVLLEEAVLDARGEDRLDALDGEHEADERRVHVGEEDLAVRGVLVAVLVAAQVALLAHLEARGARALLGRGGPGEHADEAGREGRVGEERDDLVPPGLAGGQIRVRHLLEEDAGLVAVDDLLLDEELDDLARGGDGEHRLRLVVVAEAEGAVDGPALAAGSGDEGEDGVGTTGAHDLAFRTGLGARASR